MKRSWIGPVALLMASCVQGEKHTTEVPQERGPAAIEDQAPRLIYVTYKDPKIEIEEYSAGKWQGKEGKFDEATREDKLVKIYFANTREKSNKGLKHAACFYGSAQKVAQEFFDGTQSDNKVRFVDEIKTRASSDGRMIGVRANHKGYGSIFFRLSHCDSGKSTIAGLPSDQALLDPHGMMPTKKVMVPALGQTKRSVANEAASASVEITPGSIDPKKGFEILDKGEIDLKKMPRFAMRADYDQAAKQKEERPWAGLDLRDKKDALKFTLFLQKYFYENMANQSPNPDFNFIAENNKSRYWCHMPWMNVGTTGREAVHGMTQERDMVPSKKLPAYKDTRPGTNWGVAYFNAPGCMTMGEVFGTAANPKAVPDFSKSSFKNGTAIIKILFTTAELDAIKDAFTWNGNASDVGSTERKIRPLRHIQMDIAVKDDSLKGVSPDLQNWAMAGFYFDPTYDYDTDLKAELGGMENPLKSIKGLPAGLLKMRPMGVQTGFDAPATGDTILFAGASSNGSGDRLNGPADNPRTSCLGCHAAAGTGASMVPGFLSMKMFEPYKENTQLDFNQQLALAKRNIETEIVGGTGAAQ